MGGSSGIKKASKGITKALVRAGMAYSTGGFSEVARATKFKPLQKVTSSIGPGGLSLISSDVKGMSEEAVGLPDPFVEPEIKLPSMPTKSDIRQAARKKARIAKKLKPGRLQTILTRGTGIFDE